MKREGRHDRRSARWGFASPRLRICRHPRPTGLSRRYGALARWVPSAPHRADISSCSPSVVPTSGFVLASAAASPVAAPVPSIVPARLDRLEGPQSSIPARFAAWRLADISTHSPGRNIKSNRGALIMLAISFPAPLTLAAIAIASALARQRPADSTAPIALGATAIASALATHRLIASALASQRFGIERPRAWRLA
jgi:hypothetical protein